LGLYFLAENNPSNLKTWINYSEDGNYLFECGFVQVLEVLNMLILIKPR